MKRRDVGRANNQCIGCVYYRLLSSNNVTGLMACHYILCTRKRRERDGEKCRSYQPKRVLKKA